MGANKLEAFEMETVKRNEISGADYNPRKISEAAAKKLRKFLRENGLWSPLVVNRRTMTLVSGHQRLASMDMILRKDDYDMTIAMVDVDEKTEVKGNIFLNNQSAMGEWDFMKLEDIHEMFPEINFETDLAFEPADIDFLIGEQTKEENKKEAEECTADTFRETKKSIRAAARKENEEGDSYQLHDADYQVTIVFPNNLEKREFMRKIGKKPEERFLKSSVIHDIYHHVFALSPLDEEGF